ncbi:hypothetical protein J0871_16890 [Salegentibacter sp. BDJ18]|uniref:hypothetical protein n=1 Tax=Salegentibacter sp. BDJ18 TaxID=2816376 RepID=UPI001AAF479E|nr:hypothetical protein [Salegentibacter sp. BDJ18]MBO2546095.1 hypothetical protein [Salegentibacter sp. BDJ18]
MKWKDLAKTSAYVKNLLGIKEIPVAEGKVAYSDDQLKKLEGTIGEDDTKKLVDAFNKELSKMSENEEENEKLKKSQQELKEAKEEMDKLLAETDLTDEEKKQLLENNGESNAKDGEEQTDAQLSAQIKLFNKKLKDQDAILKKLMEDPEGDSPLAIINQEASKMKHSATHLFSTGAKYDAFEGRPWNQRLRDGGAKATDFNDDAYIPLLQKDAEHFVRENPQALESLFNDFEELPKEWSRRSGVLDRTSSGRIIPGEIVQGRSKGWKPKNKFKIAAEVGRVFRKKIDITFDGYELQEIENTWIRMYNKVGSHPWKMSFIGFLLTELVKQMKVDDRNAQINGIHAETPAGDGNPGEAVNSQDGLLYLYWLYRDVEKKYRAFSMGEPTKAGILDYVKDLIERVPEKDRKRPGLELQISTEKLQWYKEKAGLVYQLHMSDDEGRMEYKRNHPIDYPNIMFQEIKDMTQTGFMAITQSKNVEIMDYNVSEKGKFTIQHDKRDTNIFADYRLGIRLQFVGTKLLPGEPAAFERQVVWSNDVPIFPASTSVPVFDDGTGILKVHYYNMKVDSEFKTDIASIEGAKKGQIIKITGNTEMIDKKVKNNDEISLTGGADFSLNSGGTLVLYANADGTFKELRRTTEPEAPNVDTQNTFDGTVIDAKSYDEYFYTGEASTTLTEIVNGVDGKQITVYGTDAATVSLTLESVAGNIALTGNAVLASKADFIELIKVDGVWTEVSRTIAVV